MTAVLLLAAAAWLLTALAVGVLIGWAIRGPRCPLCELRDTGPHQPALSVDRRTS